MPRLLIADGVELWRAIENSALRRAEVSIALVRERSEIASRARLERFDAVLAPAEAAGDPLGLENLPPARVIAWPSGGGDLASRLGLATRKFRRRRAQWWVEARTPARFRARTRDASRDGLFLAGAPDLAVGTRLEAVLRASARGAGARASLEVVRVERQPSDSYRLEGVAVRLWPEADEDAERLAGWLAEAAAERR